MLLKWDLMKDMMRGVLLIPESLKDLTAHFMMALSSSIIPQRLFVSDNVFLPVVVNYLLSLSVVLLLFSF